MNVMSLQQNADYMTGQVLDLSEKLEQSESQLGRSSFLHLDNHDKKPEDKLSKATKDGFVIVQLHFNMPQT